MNKKRSNFTKSTKEDLGTVLEKLQSLFTNLFKHDGYGQIEISMRILKKGQKEIILKYGKEHRFVVDSSDESGDKLL
ncbi:MAG: hypothetical protein U9O87_01155 [Verrucomicrobiota bacterium]|nr:hypothetical protein [Verrucomicrobiota bacterium]